MKTTMILLASAVVLSGCAGSAWEVNRSMIVSRDVYKACLVAKSGACERERQLFEADLAVHRAVTAGQPSAVVVAPLPAFVPR